MKTCGRQGKGENMRVSERGHAIERAKTAIERARARACRWEGGGHAVEGGGHVVDRVEGAHTHIDTNEEM